MTCKWVTGSSAVKPIAVLLWPCTIYLSVVECEAPLSVSYLYRFYYYLKNCNLTLRASNLLATLNALSYFFLFSVIIQKVCNYWNEGNKNTNTNTSIVLKCFISTHQLSLYDTCNFNDVRRYSLNRKQKGKACVR